MADTHGSHWIEREDSGAVTVVRLKTPGLLDQDSVRSVFDPILTIVGCGRVLLVLNLATVDYLPSMGLAKLVMLNRKVQAGQGRLALCQLSPTIEEILETTGLSDLFHRYATEQEAMQSFA